MRSWVETVTLRTMCESCLFGVVKGFEAVQCLGKPFHHGVGTLERGPVKRSPKDQSDRTKGLGDLKTIPGTCQHPTTRGQNHYWQYRRIRFEREVGHTAVYVIAGPAGTVDSKQGWDTATHMFR
jgi:hypothetical protein